MYAKFERASPKTPEALGFFSQILTADAERRTPDARRTPQSPPTASAPLTVGTAELKSGETRIICDTDTFCAVSEQLYTVN